MFITTSQNLKFQISKSISFMLEFENEEGKYRITVLSVNYSNNHFTSTRFHLETMHVLRALVDSSDLNTIKFHSHSFFSQTEVLKTFTRQGWLTSSLL